MLIEFVVWINTGIVDWIESCEHGMTEAGFFSCKSFVIMITGEIFLIGNQSKHFLMREFTAMAAEAEKKNEIMSACLQVGAAVFVFPARAQCELRRQNSRSGYEKPHVRQVVRDRSPWYSGEGKSACGAQSWGKADREKIPKNGFHRT
jgi:hypothetical protein